MIGRLFLAYDCVVSSLHVRLSHSLRRVSVLSVVNAVVSQPCLCRDAATARSDLERSKLCTTDCLLQNPA